MINTRILKSFTSNEETTNIIKDIKQEQICDQESITMTIEQIDKNQSSIEKQLIINSELDMDLSGYYKSKLNGYEVSNVPRKYSEIKEDVEYLTEINSFVENSGMTVQNIDLTTLEGTYIKLSDFGKDFLCGNIIDNIVLPFEKTSSDILILDFKDIESMSENFLERLTKYLLKTSNKVIPINMKAQLLNDFSTFILTNLIDPDLLEEEE